MSRPYNFRKLLAFTACCGHGRLRATTSKGEDFEIELDLTVNGGVPAIETTVVDRSLSYGSTCARGGGTPLPGSDAIDAIAQGVVLDQLEQAITNGTPPLELQGLDFGGLIQFGNPSLIEIENDGDPTKGDYLGATGQAVP